MTHPLHDPFRERDACGIGFVADARGRRSRELVERLLAGLAGVEHRGATAGDGTTGDGAGVLLPISPFLVPAPDCGLAMVFLRDDAGEAEVEAACCAERLEPAGWRDVPVEPSSLGAHARATMPRIRQLALARPSGIDAGEAELRAFRARRRAERSLGVYVASLSFRTVTYKALCSAARLAEVYPDLRDPALTASFGLFHQRFSTNTEPTWERAQPFRLLGHNGEINTIEGNARWLNARAGGLGSPDEELLLPPVDASGSDSAILDEALELLVRHGRDVRHSLAMLVPEAARPEHAEELRAFRRYHAGLVEPWDGPAAIVFSDGRVVGAALDRNGLRPLRWCVAGDLVVCASEAGAVPLPEGVPVRRGRLGPGQMLAVDPERGLELDHEVKRRLAAARPWGEWIAARRTGAPGEPEPGVPAPKDLARRHVLFGYTREELSLVLRPLAGQAREAVSSMGDDTALPPLAGRARRLPSYFRQRFAQVTNPALDHVRERSVMSLATLLGPRGQLLREEPEHEAFVELPTFFLFPAGLRALERTADVDAVFTAEEGLARACERVAQAAEAAARDGAAVIVVRDEPLGPAAAPLPALLALAAAHTRLVERGLRTRASLVVDSGEPREPHDFAVLLGYGADAICPRLALETVAALAAADKLGGVRPGPADAQLRFQRAIEEGVLKVLAKLGISDVASYRGAGLFEGLGLARELVDRFFPGTRSALDGIGLAELEEDALGRSAAAADAGQPLENPGYVKFRPGGEPHETTPQVIDALQAATGGAHALRGALRHGRSDLYDRFARLVNDRAAMEPRDLLELVPARRRLPLADVEPVEEIVRRFSGGAMSYGALSAEAHEVLAVALNRLGARSNSGEGGEDPERYRTERNSRIKQVASARFGVTPEYAVFADELQIKIAQGSKPGEGGQIPAHKVTADIARLRHTRPGVELISPPPHHDIYSIEDLAQLVFDLRQVNPAATISVKLVAQVGVGLVAAGVAKALADVVHVGGADGGTGASPLGSIKHAGVPWEVGLAETQQVLVASGLRGRVRLRVDGGFKTGRDVVAAALLGADEFSFGTALLVAEGCLMVRSCHLDSCPVGIASQRPELRAKFAGTPEAVEAYLLFVAGEVRRLLAQLGLPSLDEAVGRVECLRQRVVGDARADALDLAPLLASAGGGPRRFVGEPVPTAPGGELGERLAAVAAPVLEEACLVEPAYEIGNRDRAVGARLGGAVASRFGARAPEGRVRARFIGAAGQSFGAFLTRGVELELCGEANDYVGKSMSGGRISIAPPPGDAGAPTLLGNTALYGATGGALFCAGAAGERFAVRNSGATGVVEGVGDHACEYMTDGTVVVLGPHGANLGAGMTGGEAFVLDVRTEGVNQSSVVALPLAREDEERLRELLERHVRRTRSAVAAELLDAWPAATGRFTRLVSVGSDDAQEAPEPMQVERRA